MGWMLFVLVLAASSIFAAASDSSIYKQAMKAYKAGNYTTAQQYFNQLPKTESGAYVGKMDSKMKSAYRSLVKKYRNKTSGPFHFSMLAAYYLTDMDLDGKSELILKVGTCEADYEYYVYQYKSGKAKKIGHIGAAHANDYQNPADGGIVVLDASMSYEQIRICKIKGSKLKTTSLKERRVGMYGSYIQLPYRLAGYSGNSGPLA